MKRLKQAVIGLSMTLSMMGATSLAVAEENPEDNLSLTFSYWDEATPPFIQEESGVVKGGIIKDLGEAIAQALGLQAKFVRLPVGRIEQQLQDGMIDLDCVTSPIWKEKPGDYHWSPLLFESFDRFLVRSEIKSKIQSFSDLKGMRLGIYNGYVYHSDIMALIEQGDVDTTKVSGVEHGIKLLQLGRIDALIDFGILLRYQIMKLNLAPQITLADLPADQYNLHCAYSKKMKVSSEAVDEVIRQIVRSGKLDKVLKRYR